MGPWLVLRTRLLACSLLVFGCRTPSPTAADPMSTSAAEAASHASAGRSAFVVLTADATLVIPIDPALPVETLPGHWVGALPGTPPRAFGRVPVELTTREDPRLPSLPVCASGSVPGSCSILVDLHEPEPHAALATATGTAIAQVEAGPGEAPRWSLVSPTSDEACTCVVINGLSTDGLAVEPDDPDAEEPMPDLSACGEEPDTDYDPVTYVGGVLYLAGLYNNMSCSGMNLYEGISRAVPLRPGATEPSLSFGAPVGCQAETPLEDLGLARLEAGGLACEPQDPEQMVVYSLQRGRLVRAFGSTREGALAAECACASGLPVDPASCPSALDPCGHGRELAGPHASGELWVTTDERLALAPDEDGLVVLAAGDPEPIRRVPTTAGTKILGVEHHPDSVLLDVEPPPLVVRAAIPPRHPDDASFDGSAKAWGNRCFAHLQAERLDAAEAACYAGLLAQGTKATRGALTYNLGRVAEARGDRARARAYYERSQELRPHQATAERLRGLGGT